MDEHYLVVVVNVHKRRDRAAYFGVLPDLPSAVAVKARVDHLTPIHVHTKIVRMNPVGLLGGSPSELCGVGA